MRHLLKTMERGEMLLVEDATAQDAAALTQLHHDVLMEDRYFITHADEFDGRVEQKRAHIERTLRQVNSCMMVARLDGTMVGVVSLYGGVLRRMQHVARLEIFVARHRRGMGVGQALMDAMLAWAIAHPTLSKISLSVFDDNERAIAMYRQRGFVEEGRRPMEYGEPDGTMRGDVLMYRWVTPDGTAPD